MHQLWPILPESKKGISDFASDSAQCIDTDTQKLCNVFQFHSIDKPGIVFEKHLIAFFRCELKSLHEEEAQHGIALLVNDAPPVGYVDIPLVEGIQAIDGHGIDKAIGQRLHTLDGGIAMIERIHTKGNITLATEPGGGVFVVLVEYGASNTLLDKVHLPVLPARVHQHRILGIVHGRHTIKHGL